MHSFDKLLLIFGAGILKLILLHFSNNLILTQFMQYLIKFSHGPVIFLYCAFLF